MIMTVIMSLLYVHITWLPNNISLHALLNMSENGHLVTKLRTGDMKGFYVKDMEWKVKPIVNIW
jgi:hypothetical protein